MIKKTIPKELVEDSLEYTRMITHLKYLSERILRHEPVKKDTTEDIRTMLMKNCCLSSCLEQIVEFVKTKYNYDLSVDEQTYLCIHIKKLM